MRLPVQQNLAMVLLQVIRVKLHGISCHFFDFRTLFAYNSTGCARGDDARMGELVWSVEMVAPGDGR